MTPANALHGPEISPVGPTTIEDMAVCDGTETVIGAVRETPGIAQRPSGPSPAHRTSVDPTSTKRSPFSIHEHSPNRLTVGNSGTYVWRSGSSQNSAELSRRVLPKGSLRPQARSAVEEGRLRKHSLTRRWLGISVVGCTLLVAGCAASDDSSARHVPESASFASWAFVFEDLGQMFATADLVVEAKVTDVDAGDQKGPPGTSTIPPRRFTLEPITTYSGRPPANLQMIDGSTATSAVAGVPYIFEGDRIFVFLKNFDGTYAVFHKDAMVILSEDGTGLGANDATHDGSRSHWAAAGLTTADAMRSRLEELSKANEQGQLVARKEISVENAEALRTGLGEPRQLLAASTAAGDVRMDIRTSDRSFCYGLNLDASTDTPHCFAYEEVISYVKGGYAVSYVHRDERTIVGVAPLTAKRVTFTYTGDVKQTVETTPVDGLPFSVIMAPLTADPDAIDVGISHSLEIEY